MKKSGKRIVIVCVVIIVLILLLCSLFVVRIYTDIRKMSSLETQQVIDQVYAVQDTFVNLFLIKSGDTYIAVDAGNNVEHVRQELEILQIDPQNVTAVFLTHTDADHVAALKLFSKATIYLSGAEEQMINGQTARFLFLKNSLDCSYEMLEDNQIFDISGLQVKGILTPGHTPGSMCYLINGTYLFTGDSTNLQNGKINEFNDLFNMDSETQRISLRKLAKLSRVKYVFTAHYGFTDNYQHAFENWKN